MSWLTVGKLAMEASGGEQTAVYFLVYFHLPGAGMHAGGRCPVSLRL
jgi:hypothetical protein